MKTLLSVLQLILLISIATADDWRESGGTPAKNMVSSVTGIPIDLDPGKKKPAGDEIDMAMTQHCVWVAKIGSQCYRAPTVAGGKVLIGTNNDSPRNQRTIGDRGVKMCFDEKTGKFLWQLTVPKLGAGKIQDWEFFGICSTALIHKNRAYVITNSCQVACLDLGGLADGNAGPFKGEAAYMTLRYHPEVELADTDADIIWLYDMRLKLGVFPHNLTSSSPTLIDGKLVVNTSNGTDWSHTNIPAKEAPCLITLDPETGKLLGEENAGISERIQHSNWSSPATAVIDGKPTIFFGGGDGIAYSFNSNPVEDEDGFDIFPENWRIDCNPPEYRVDENGQKRKYATPGGPSEIIATPVIYDDHIYVAIGQNYEHGEGAGMLSCINARTGKRVWENREVERTVSTASIADGLLYISDFRGRVHCLDAKSGKKHWTFDTKSHIWGSTLVVDGKVLIGNEDGELIMLATGTTMKKLAQIEFNSPIHATPVAANGKLYIATQTHLYAFKKQSP